MVEVCVEVVVLFICVSHEQPTYPAEQTVQHFEIHEHSKHCVEYVTAHEQH